MPIALSSNCSRLNVYPPGLARATAMVGAAAIQRHWDSDYGARPRSISMVRAAAITRSTAGRR
jgi:hypothetical protein